MTTPTRWAHRIRTLRAQLDEVAEVSWADPRWWGVTLTAAAAEVVPSAPSYLVSNADPASDTIIAWPLPAADPIALAVAQARAAAAALAELDGQLPDQPLRGALVVRPHAHLVAQLEAVVEFAIGRRRIRVDLASAGDEVIAAALTAALGDRPGLALPPGRGPVLLAVTVGDEALATARHAHRRAWTQHGGPWLGLGRCGDRVFVSTCHCVVDGYGHAWLAARIASRLAQATLAPAPGPALVAPAPVPTAVPLAIAYQALPAGGRGPRAAAWAYATALVLADRLGRAGGRFSPSLQVPVAPGRRDDPWRWRRRVVPALTSVAWDGDQPEPLPRFADRLRRQIGAEADGLGPASRLLAAGSALPVPLAWKRRAVAPGARPRWLDPISEVVGGRACVSLLPPAPDGAWATTPAPLLAASAPAQLGTRRDPRGGLVVTVTGSAVDGGDRAVTLSATGQLAAVADAVLAEIVAGATRAAAAAG